MLRFQRFQITSTEVFDQPVRYGPIFELKSGCRVCFALLMLHPLVLLALAALSGPISSFTGAPTSWFLGQKDSDGFDSVEPFHLSSPHLHPPTKAQPLQQ